MSTNVLFVVAAVLACCQGADLIPRAYPPLSLGSITPAGWLERQLRLQMEGLAGHLNDFWADIMNSVWTGGNADPGLHERKAYWVNGVVNLAYLLRNTPGGSADMMAQVRSTLTYVLDHQNATTGWLGPDDIKDGNKYWGTYPMLMALCSLAEAEPGMRARVVTALVAHMREVHRRARDETPLFDWSKSRYMDLVMSAHWVIDSGMVGPDVVAQMRALADLAHAQGDDWETFFSTLDRRAGGSLVHGVNDMQAVKSSAVWWRQSGDPKLVRSSVQRMANLDAKYGFPTGVICADELLCEDEESNHPSRGAELCAVVEGMFSYETMWSVHGNVEFADRTERIAFNALPATWASQRGGDVWNHQYLQATNEINAMPQGNVHIWTHDGGNSEVYGLEPNYGCCTANFPQGWPKFASMMFGCDENGVAVGLYAPASATLCNGLGTITVNTEYPFDDLIVVTLYANKPTTLSLRIPTWATAATIAVNGGAALKPQAGTMYQIPVSAAGTIKAMLKLNPQVRLEEWYPGSVSVMRGPLLFAYNIPGDYTVLKSYSFESVDLQVLPVSGTAGEWRWALDLDPSNIAASLRYVQPGWNYGQAPFNHTEWPCYIEATARPVNAWGLYKNSAAAPPASPACSVAGACGNAQKIRLVPFGGTDLRIAQMPLSFSKVPSGLPKMG